MLSLAALDDSSGADGLLRTLALVQAAGEPARPVPVWAFTRGAVEAAPGDEIIRPLDALVTGLGRVAGLETPQRWGGTLDLPGVLHDGWAVQALGSIAAGDHEDQIALRSDARYVRRLRRSAPKPSAEPSTLSGTALITGGRGALGAHLAGWLAEHGIGQVVLASRRAGITPELAGLRERLAAAGATLTVEACDVADRDAVRTLIDRIDRGPHPLTVVAHLAGVSRVTALDDITAAAATEELAAKVTGAWNLHELLAGRPLTAFLLYGSGASLWGGAGQAVYGAANTALDALARHRRSLGSTATVLHWGGWSGGGMVTAEVERQLRALGLRSMAPARALHALDLALRADVTALGVSDMDWTRFAPVYCAARPRPLLDLIEQAGTAVRAGTAAHDPAAGRELRARLTALPAGERLAEMVRLVQSQSGPVLGVAPTAVDATRPLQQLGLDSLMAVTVRGHLARLTGLSITTDVLLRLETCAAIGSHLLAELGLGAPSASDAVARTGDQWLRVLRTASTPRARIICAAGMGGTTSAHLPLSRHLPDGFEVLGVQLPGREARAGEAPVSDMATVVDGVLDALRDRPAVPTVLYGHSQGSWIAWELAHRLAARGVTDLGLVVACSLPPLAPPTEALRQLETLADGWDDVPRDRLAEMFRGILPGQVLESEQLLTEYLAALRSDVALAADHQARLCHRPHGLLDIPVRAVEAAADPVLPAGAMQAWADLTVGRWTVEVVQGSHAAPIENAPALAGQLTAMADELTGAASATGLELAVDR